MKTVVLTILSLSIFLLESHMPSKNKSIVHTEKHLSKHVIVLVIDGPRYSETFGDSTFSYIPLMGRKLIPEGSLYTNFRNNGPTYTNSGHTAITTGNYQRISNAGKELPKSPSFFQYYLKSHKADKTSAWIVSSKGKLEILSNCTKKDWWNLYMPSTYCGVSGLGAEYSGDEQTMKKVMSLLSGDAPELMLINLLAVDSYGHSNEWENYLQSIKKCDQFAFDLWQYIQSSDQLKNNTTLLITNDHGRHLDGHKSGFVNHGDKCEGCRHISLLAMGPDIHQSKIIQSEGELIDISATIAYLLQFDMPTSKGRILSEMLKSRN